MLSRGNFEKYFMNFVAKTAGLSRIDLTILFQKVSSNEREVDIFTAYELVEALRTKLNEKSEAGGDVFEFIELLE